MIQKMTFDSVNVTKEFDNWYEGLDSTQQTDVERSLYKFINGNTNQVKYLSNDLYELKLYSGIRVYFARVDTSIILLWGGKKKKRQSHDIELAYRYLDNYKEQLQRGR